MRLKEQKMWVLNSIRRGFTNIGRIGSVRTQMLPIWPGWSTYQPLHPHLSERNCKQHTQSRYSSLKFSNSTVCCSRLYVIMIVTPVRGLELIRSIESQGVWHADPGATRASAIPPAGVVVGGILGHAPPIIMRDFGAGSVVNFT